MELLYVATYVAVLCIGGVNSDILVYTEFSNQVIFSAFFHGQRITSIERDGVHSHSVLFSVVMQKFDCNLQLIEEFRDMPAKFGRQLPTNGLKVHGITGNPVNGCSTLEPPPNSPDMEGFKWAVLIAR